MSTLQLIIIGLSAFAAGGINALAGGGTLITFPVLTALGIPAITANVTNTVALCPGYFGATLSQRQDLRDQIKRLWLLIPAAIIGGLSGALILLFSGERLFKGLIPYLILFASILLAIGEPLKKWMKQKKGQNERSLRISAAFPITIASLYGGYFGAGLSVIILATLGLFYHDSLTRLNALKQALAFATNIAAAFVFIFSGKVSWSIAIIMAVCALVGGSLGGRLASKINPAVLRWVVVSLGLVVSLLYFINL
ncbi:MAG: sulfite exporter TauE/SafE family protein [Chloroflexi bacterium]|nr:sulfite exporter TauE/SafE family protein [Chloroflexota bacterium]